jgi:hypothetical protein
VPTVAVYDIASGNARRNPDVAGVHGVIAVPELGRVYATATGTSEVAAIDPLT